MKTNGKDWISVLGGALAMAAVIFGVGLYLLGSSATKKLPANTEEKIAKEDAHGDAHGEKAEKKADEHGHGEAKSEKKEDAHGESKDKKDKKEKKDDSHGGGHGEEKKEEKPPRIPPRKSKDQMSEWIADGEKALTYGNYEQAVEKFNLALKLAPNEQGLDDLKSLAMVRLADATRKCDSIAMQRRSERALDLYSKLLAEYPNSREAETAQFNVGFCLEELGKFAEAEQAFGRFASQYPFSSKVPDARVNQAANLMVQNEALKAKKLLQTTLKLEMNDDTRSRVLARIAQADLMLARQGLLPDEAQVAKAEAVALKEQPKKTPPPPEKAPVRDDERGTYGFSPQNFQAATNLKANTQPGQVTSLLTEDDQKQLAAVKPNGIPEEQWLRVIRSLDTGNLGEARHLMRSYLDESGPNNSVNPQQYLNWARVLRSVAERKIAVSSTTPEGGSK
jgi:tetratricopeptide (TPR) repeat protein